MNGFAEIKILDSLNFMGRNRIVNIGLFLNYYYYVLLTLGFFTVCKLIVYEFRLKYLEIYTVKEALRIPVPKTWKDIIIIRVHETISGLLKYEVHMNNLYEIYIGEIFGTQICVPVNLCICVMVNLIIIIINYASIFCVIII